MCSSLNTCACLDLMVCQYACTTEGFFEPTEAFSYIGLPKYLPFSIVHPLSGLIAVYCPRSPLSLPLGFFMEGVGTILFMVPFQLPVDLTRLEVLPIPFSLSLSLFEQLGGG